MTIILLVHFMYFVEITDWDYASNAFSEGLHFEFRPRYYFVFLDFTENLQANSGKIFHSKTSHVGTQGEYRHRSSLSLTSVPDGDGWSTPDLDRFTTWGKKKQFPLYRRLLGHAVRLDGYGNSTPPPPGFDLRVAKPSTHSRPTVSQLSHDPFPAKRFQLTFASRPAV